ncbi:coiled-coil domain-containing protein 24 isoform X1 [Xyrauchen texanus]|uniref:coiled-coil domain-containing protein 24 isoform X1 n=1 Tax=Xyrauchen texanus TaxID=154827 RepID=UPI002241CE12|nr:coiled-coil domain-containing protein 24 isoform X1 [Xyrauchen texanus]XP_051984624.1 coiled-coil domain-containing protein 24 isoform X1 [Xyrauchen texanus]
MDNFQRKQSVWNLVRENVPYSELPEFRAVLGETLIDTYTELYSEVEIWETIWQEVHRSEQGSRPETPVFPLADPPAIKGLLKAEIQLLLLTLRERAARQGRDEEEVMSQYSPSVVSYALGSTQRQGSPGSWCERPLSSLSETRSRSVSSLSSHSSFVEEIKALRHKLNISHIEEVVSHLRSVLTEECEALKRDVQVLQENVDIERASRQRGATPPEPTVAELKEERRLIQRDWKVQNLLSCYSTTDILSTRNPQILARETSKLDLSAPGIYASHLKPCPPRDITAVSHNQREKPNVGASKTSVSPSDTAQHRKLDQSDSSFSIASSLKSDLRLMRIKNSSTTEPKSSIPSSAMEHESMPKESKYRGNSVRASAFRLVPAASVTVSGSAKNLLLKMEVTRDSDLGHLQPTPPTVQRPPSRGQRGSRHQRIPQPDSLLSA